jgi:four helix bundle protein
MAGFEELEVWKRSVELSSQIYVVTKDIRDFGFRDQLTRAGLSIPSNIAEGMERSTAADQCKFLDYARGSCGEAIVVGYKVGFIVQSIADNSIAETKVISAMIQGLIKSIRSRNT